MHCFIVKIPNKREFQQISNNRPSDIGFIKNVLQIVIFFDAVIFWFLSFKKNLLERIWKLIMTIDDKIRDKKLQCDINREAAKISTLSSKNINKYEYLTG